jgi:hypothetical protein
MHTWTFKLILEPQAISPVPIDPTHCLDLLVSELIAGLPAYGGRPGEVGSITLTDLIHEVSVMYAVTDRIGPDESPTAMDPAATIGSVCGVARELTLSSPPKSGGDMNLQ